MGNRKIKTPNKLLCITSNKTIVYFGDFAGNIMQMDAPYHSLEKLYTLNEPISSLIFNEHLYAATWNGNIYKGSQKKKNLGKDIIKAIACFKNKLFASMEEKLYILNKDLEIERVVDSKYKILCMCEFNNYLYFGNNVPYISRYGNEYNNENDNVFEIIDKLEHDTSILGLTVVDNSLVSCSADGKIIKDGVVIYESKGWIRSIHGNAFADGNKLYVGNRNIFTHADNISMVSKLGNVTFSAGLDGIIYIDGFEEVCTIEEEKELQAILAECEN